MQSKSTVRHGLATQVKAPVETSCSQATLATCHVLFHYMFLTNMLTNLSMSMCIDTIYKEYMYSIPSPYKYIQYSETEYIYIMSFVHSRVHEQY